MTNNTYEIETREVTKERTFITINGESLRAAKVLDFINELEETDGFTTVRWCHKYNNIAENMIDVGLAKKN